MKKICSFMLLLLMQPLLFVCPRGDNNTSIRIYYTSSLNGNLDGCDCKSGPRSGLVKRAYFLHGYRDRENSILIDGGDILDVYPDELLALEILQVYQELGYDVVAVGDQEFANGANNLLEYRKNYPLLSNNLVVCPDESRCIFFSTSPLILIKAGYKIGIFSILDPEVFVLYPDELKQVVKLSSPADTARNMIHILNEEEVDIKILLYHGYYESAVKLLSNIQGIDVAVVGHEQRLFDAEKINNTILVSPGEEGNRLGILELMVSGNVIEEYKNSFILFSYTEDPDDSSVRKRIESYKKALRSLTGKS